MLAQALQKAFEKNPWFTPGNIMQAFKTWGRELTAEKIGHWISAYHLEKSGIKPKEVAVVMAGNIPLVGFHDFISVLMAGHAFAGKLASGDPFLLPAVARLLIEIEPGFKPFIRFTDAKIENFDAVIATGSNNSSRYFEYYFSKVPHIIRRNRNGIAVLDGTETQQQLGLLAADICSYFGLGCRNVSKIFVPAGYDVTTLFTGTESFGSMLGNHFKYMNNYNYNRSIYLLNQVEHFDNGFQIITESRSYSSPIAVVHYEFYHDFDDLKVRLADESDNIQCIVTGIFNNASTVDFGTTQQPALWDYADGTDTLNFLLGLEL